MIKNCSSLRNKEYLLREQLRRTAIGRHQLDVELWAALVHYDNPIPEQSSKTQLRQAAELKNINEIKLQTKPQLKIKFRQKNAPSRLRTSSQPPTFPGDVNSLLEIKD